LSLENWNFFNRNVQSGLLEGRFLNAAFTLVAAGPPRLEGLFSDGSAADDLEGIAFPMGILQSIGLGQSSQVMRLWEIGSQRSYFIRGRTAGQMSLGRIMYHGPSLLRVLYAFASGKAAGKDFKALYTNNAMASLNIGAGGTNGGKNSTFEVAPGYENLWLNLASDIFDQPIGLLVLLRDSNNSTVGAFYVEYCMVQNHNWQTDAGGTILAENCSLVYERIEPVNVQAVELIASSEDIKSLVGGSVIGSAA
jgi:hypothetical protein